MISLSGHQCWFTRTQVNSTTTVGMSLCYCAISRVQRAIFLDRSWGANRRRIFYHLHSSFYYGFMYTGPHQGCTNIKLPKSSKRYQFRVQLSCADRRHCFTIGNVTCPYGLSASIRDEWRGLWNGTNGDGLLCARSSIFQRNYYSRTFHFRDNGNSVILTDDIYASNNNTQNNCTDLFPMSSCLNNPPLANGQYNRCLFAWYTCLIFLLSTVTRVCRCNGTWSPRHPSLEQCSRLCTAHLMCVIRFALKYYLTISDQQSHKNGKLS